MKIILQSPVSDHATLSSLVNDCLASYVQLIAVIGPGCEDVHDRIDDILLAQSFGEVGSVVTTWHTGETLEEVAEFAGLFGNGAGVIKYVRL